MSRYVSSQRRKVSPGTRSRVLKATSGIGARDFNPTAGMPTSSYANDYGVLGRCVEAAAMSGERCLVPAGVSGRCPTHERAWRQRQLGRG